MYKLTEDEERKLNTVDCGRSALAIIKHLRGVVEELEGEVFTLKLRVRDSPPISDAEAKLAKILDIIGVGVVCGPIG